MSDQNNRTPGRRRLRVRAVGNGSGLRALPAKPRPVGSEPAAEFPGGMTMKELVELWLALSLNRVKLSSYERYCHLARRHILPALGAEHVSALTAERLADFVREKQESGRIDGSGGLSPKTISDILVIVKSSLKLAMREYGVRIDAGAVDVRASKARLNRIEVFSHRETERIIAAVRAAPTLGNAAFLVSLEAGLRLGEVCALKWGDIDFDEGTLCVRRTVLRVERQGGTALQVQAPKTETSERAVPLTKKLLSMLRRLRRGSAEDYIFTGRPDRPMEPRTMQYRFSRFLKAQGIRPRGFHTLRHSFATRCVENGVDVKTLAEILGHSNVQTTLQMYVHPSMDQKRRSLERASSMK